MTNTDFRALLIYDNPYDRTLGRAPPAGHPDAEEYTRRFAAWAASETAARRITITPLGTAQERSDYRDSR